MKCNLIVQKSSNYISNLGFVITFNVWNFVFAVSKVCYKTLESAFCSKPEQRVRSIDVYSSTLFTTICSGEKNLLHLCSIIQRKKLKKRMKKVPNVGSFFSLICYYTLSMPRYNNKPASASSISVLYGIFFATPFIAL